MTNHLNNCLSQKIRGFFELEKFFEVFFHGLLDFIAKGTVKGGYIFENSYAVIDSYILASFFILHLTVPNPSY